MPPAAQETLKALLPFATVNNPVDTTAQALNDMTLLARNIEVMLDQGGYDALIGFFTTVPNTRNLPVRCDAIAQRLPGVFRTAWIAGDDCADREIVRDYERAGFLIFEDADRGVAALAALSRFGQSFDRARTQPVVAVAAPIGKYALSEHAAKALGQAGVPFLDERPGDRAGAAPATLPTRSAIPSSWKIVSPEIEHKTEIGGVLVGVGDRAAVESGYATLMVRAREHRPDASVEGVLVAPMAGKAWR